MSRQLLGQIFVHPTALTESTDEDVELTSSIANEKNSEELPPPPHVDWALSKELLDQLSISSSEKSKVPPSPQVEWQQRSIMEVKAKLPPRNTGLQQEEVVHLKQKFNELFSKSEILSRKVAELDRSAQSRWERMQKSVQVLDSGLKEALRILGEKFLSISGKLNERKISDVKVQELMDRHNQVVVSFESRLGQLQKVVSEMEMKVIGSHGSVEELRREVERLKKLLSSSSLL